MKDLTAETGPAEAEATASVPLADQAAAAGVAKPARPRKPRPTPAEIRAAFETGAYPYADRLSRRTYEAQKARLQAELLKVQKWVGETRVRIGDAVSRGADAAGRRGGTIIALHRASEPARGRASGGD